MNDGTTKEKTPLQEARILQASVMDATSVLLIFSNGSSALVDCEQLKELVINSGAKIVHEDEVID